jgi:predicted SAM-dependent methyltransferase
MIKVKGNTMEKPAEFFDIIKEKMEAHSDVSLELGCGDRKRHTDAIGIDVLDYGGVDIVGDIGSVLKQFPDRSVSSVYSYHCFEHLQDIGSIVEQLGRIMKSHSKLYIVVPHFSNPYYYSDTTHQQPFGLYSFSYYAKDQIFARRCPDYQRQIKFEIEQVKLVFKSPRPFYGRYGIKKIIQAIVNMNHYSLEFYEENLCWLIPCYEIQYRLLRL